MRSSIDSGYEPEQQDKEPSQCKRGHKPDDSYENET